MAHHDVYLSETCTMYFVHFPDTGEVMNVPKASVPDNRVGFHEDAAHREALLETWRANNPERERVTERREDVRHHQEQQRATGAPPAHTLPSKPRRAIPLIPGSDTLPKIVLNNPPVMAATPRQPQQQRYGGMGGMGGMGMGGMGVRNVTLISNISDLFFNIDDRLVGEMPAEIHTTYLFQQRLGNGARGVNHNP